MIDFYYSSEGISLPVPKFFRQSEKNLAKLQRRFAKTEKGSKKRQKILKSLQKTHFKIKSQRNAFLHKAANELLSKSDVIVLEDLNIKGMSRRPKPKKDEETGSYLPNGASRKSGLNKSIGDVGWYKFINILEYKSELLGKRVKKVPANYTSQICCKCDEIVKKALSERTHRCTNCGYVAPRDENSAIYIKRLGQKFLGIQSLEAPTIALA